MEVAVSSQMFRTHCYINMLQGPKMDQHLVHCFVVLRNRHLRTVDCYWTGICYVSKVRTHFFGNKVKQSAA